MAIVVVVDGKVVYGDPNELRDIRFTELRSEFERLEADITRVTTELVAAAEMIETMTLHVTRAQDTLSTDPPAPTPGGVHTSVTTRRVPRHG